MNQTKLFTRIELHFWNLIIQALSRSKTAQLAIKQAFQFLYDSEAASLGVLLGISGVVGLVAGYLFYFVAVGLR